MTKKQIWQKWAIARKMAEGRLESVILHNMGTKERYYAEDHLNRVKTLEGEAKKRYEESKT